jgi:hypothetical protein
MKKSNDTVNLILAVSLTLILVFGAGYLRYKIWKWEHPTTSSWVFFIKRH